MTSNLSYRFTESTVEEAALIWLEGIGYTILHGPEIGPGGEREARADWDEAILTQRLADALARLNPQASPTARNEALRQLTQPGGPSLTANNHARHRLLVDGVAVETQRADGSRGGELIRVLDFDEPGNNEFTAVNQFTVVQGQMERRPDIVLFVNGLPLAVLELKNAADEQATVRSAYNQLQTYKQDIPRLFAYNAALVVSDGMAARVGALTADWEWFLPWRTIQGESPDDDRLPQLQVTVEGLFEPRRFLDLVRYFVVFEDVGGGTLVKKMAGYHQYHAVNAALAETIRASLAPQTPAVVLESEGTYMTRAQPDAKPGDQRAGVVWHTQGSGKSLTMAFFAGRVVLHPAMANPTLVVITDRNDLDDQLFGTFARCHELLGQQPIQAESRAHLRALLQTVGGGVIFTTVQKFFVDKQTETAHPLLSQRRNIVVIADEAHRSQYDFVDGFAARMREALPNASFIGFTGTPIELTDKNTRAVFGDYISVYDMARAVADGATVPIYYESRLAKLTLSESARPTLDEAFEEVTEGEEVEHKEKLKTKWAQLEALVGAAPRVRMIAQDLVDHFEQRQGVMDGKGMIVCMSRRICVDLYNAITALRPDWHHEADDQGLIKVVMTGSATDPLDWQQHIRSKARREALATRYKAPDDSFKLVIVRDMWLTGFDAPAMHTMYVDKPMQGHGLMQAIARVNRVFRDKPGGLVVDYLGLADSLRRALATYVESGGTGQTAIDQNEAVAVMQEKYEVCCGLFHGFDWAEWPRLRADGQMLLMRAATNFILAQADGQKRLAAAVDALSKAFALAVPHAAALAIRHDVGFFQAVRAALGKQSASDRRDPNEMDHAIRQIVSGAVASDEVIDVFAAAGLQKPDISILSDAFLAEVRGLPQRNLAVELLRRLLNDEIRTRSRQNLVQSRKFSELLDAALRRYQNRAVETAQVIEELIALAAQLKAAQQRGEDLGLSDAELAFYDALGTNDSAVQVLGDETLRKIAQEVTATIRKNVTIDWTHRETVRAKLRVLVRRVLRKHGYPPDQREAATRTVLEQAEAVAAAWAS